MTPQVWNVVFNREARSGWMRWIPGRFKHVRAYAFLPEHQLWLFYDVSYSQTEIVVLPHGQQAFEKIYSYIGPPGKSEIVSVPRLKRRKRLFPLSNWCTVALRHLLGVPGGALLPEGFYRDCLASGGTAFEKLPFEAEHGSARLQSSPGDDDPAGHPAGSAGCIACVATPAAATPATGAADSADAYAAAG